MANASIVMLWETLVSLVYQPKDAFLLQNTSKVMFGSATNVQLAASPVLPISDAVHASVAISSTPASSVLTLVPLELLLTSPLVFAYPVPMIV